MKNPTNEARKADPRATSNAPSSPPTERPIFLIRTRIPEVEEEQHPVHQDARNAQFREKCEPQGVRNPAPHAPLPVLGLVLREPNLEVVPPTPRGLSRNMAQPAFQDSTRARPVPPSASVAVDIRVQYFSPANDTRPHTITAIKISERIFRWLSEPD